MYSLLYVSLLVELFWISACLGYNHVYATTASWREQANYETPASWRKQALDAHNKYRKLFDAPPLVLNESLCRESQIWANGLVAGKTPQGMDNGKGNNYNGYFQNGQQRLMSEGSEISDPETVVERMFQHIEYIDFESVEKTPCANGNKYVCDFTQLVWKSSKSMCMSSAPGKGHHWIYNEVVGIYYPRGNVNGEYDANVVPKRDANGKILAEGVNPAMQGVYARG